MRITGKVYDNEGDTLPLARVFVSDSAGNMSTPKNVVSTLMDGNYSISVFPAEYITASFAGSAKKTIKSSTICGNKSNCSYDFKLEPIEYEGVTIIGKRPKEEKKTNWKKIALIGGISLLLIAGIVYVINKNKK